MNTHMFPNHERPYSTNTYRLGRVSFWCKIVYSLAGSLFTTLNLTGRHLFLACFLSFFIFPFSGITAVAPVIEVFPGMVNYSLREYAVLLPDKGKDLTFPGALAQLRASAFKPFDQWEIPGKFQRGQYNFWVFFTVRNVTTDTFNLFCKGSSLGKDSVFVLEDGVLSDAFRTVFPAGKDTSNILGMPFSHGFLYRLPPASERSFLIEIDDYSYWAYFLPALYDAAHFTTSLTRQTQWKTAIYLVLAGMLVTIILLFGLQYLNTWDKADLWYMLYGLAMLFVGWRNLEILNPHYTLTYFWVSWTHTKVFHSAAIFITYAFFLRYFFGDSAPVIRKLARIILGICCFFMIAELVLLTIDWYWSWLSYYWFRIIVSVLSLAFFFYIWKLPHPLARYILTGGAVLVVAEVVSWFFPPSYTSEVALVGVFLEFLFFSYAMGLRTSLERQEKVRLAYANELLAMEKELVTERLRTRIAQDIHDEVGASLTKISLTAQVAERTPGLGQDMIQQHLQRIGMDARRAAGQLKDIIFGINPDYDSFTEMQAYFLETSQEFWDSQALRCTFDFPDAAWDPTVSPDVKRHLLLIFKEAQTNASRHAGATAVRVSLALTGPDTYRMEIEDNGNGFVPDAAEHFSNGLTGMKRRAKSIGAQLDIRSEPGGGCLVRVEGKV